MLFRLVEMVEFPTTDGEDVQTQVNIIVQALHRAGVIQDNDKVHYTKGDTVKIYIYRPDGGVNPS